uniref:Lipocalin n=1 Tax=Rhipicephalus appendiculatus TaxID=34631 RepID=A0A131YFV8_RHIAP
MYKHVFVALFVLLIAGKTNTMRRCFPTRRPHRYSIKHFVNSSERIWTCRASLRTTIHCQFDIMRSINPLAIFFNRTFLIRGQRYSMRLRGEFDPRHIDRMDISVPGMQAVSRETLIYQAPNSSCGVVQILPLRRDAVPYYELRAKNSSIEGVIDRECWRHFHSVAHQEIYVYRPECQHLVRPRM